MATTDLQVYGGRDEVKELGARLQNYMPNAQKLNNLEAQAVAQIAVAHGLDPFNGEVWGIKGDDKWYGVMVGIKGLRKCARRQAEGENSHYWITTSYADPKEYGEPATSVVALCVLQDQKSVVAYAQAFRALRDAGFSYDDAKAEMGPTPKVVGIGIATAGERSKLKINQRAMKRAEADAIKKRYDVSFGNGTFTDGDKDVPEIAIEQDPDMVDGQAEDLQDEAPAPVQTRSEARNLAELGFDEGPAIKDEPKPQYRANGAKIVGIVAEITGLDNGKAAQLILSKYEASHMLTEIEAGAFARAYLKHTEA